MKNYLIFCLVLTSFFTYAQEKLPEPINSGEILLKSDSLSKQDLHEESLALLNQINEGDTNYISSLIEKTLRLISLEKYDEALEVCELGMGIEDNPEKQVFWVNKGYILSLQDKNEESKRVYIELKKAYPWYRNVSSNLAFQYLQLEDYENSYEAYKEHILLYPFDANAHLNIGLFAYHEERYAEALMALNMVILLTPYTEKSYSILNILNELSNNTKVEKTPKEGFQFKSNEYEEINLLFENYVALKKQYKVDTKSELYLPKQNHLIFSMLQKMEITDYFFSSFYAPFYIKIMEEGWFDEMQLLELIPSKNEVHQKIVEKNMKDIKAFNDWFRSEWYSLHNKKTIDFETFKGEYQFWYRSNATIEAIGNRDENGNNQGDFLFLYPGGSKKSEGAYLDGKEEGWWNYYFEDGKKSQQIKYHAGDVIDTAFIFYENEVLEKELIFENQKRNGDFVEYYSHGVKYREGTNKDDLFEGPLSYYFKNGDQEYDLNYKEGKLNGELIEKYTTGEVYRKEQFKDGLSTGDYLLFWIDGSKRAVGKKVEGKFEGPYMYYYQNGKVQEEGSYLADMRDGEWKIYYQSGVLSEQLNYKNGELSGISKYYDHEGKLFAEKEFKEGWLISYKYFNKEGEILAEEGSKKKFFEINNYNSNGILSSSGKFAAEEGKTGKWVDYDEFGNKSAEYENVSGKIDGEIVYLFPWGAEEKRVTYSNGVLDGYYVEYYDFGQMKEQGYYTNGEINGVRESYYPDGKLESKKFYLNGVLRGKRFEYCVNGKIDYIEEYKDGILDSATYYDTLGNVLSAFKFENGAGYYTRNHYNGEEAFKGKYLLNLSDGEFIWHYPNGNLEGKGKYVLDNKEGIWMWNFSSGKLKIKGNYQYGQKVGKWTEYYDNGNVNEIELFENGDLHGLNQVFYESGAVLSEIDYSYGIIHGEYKFFSEDGELQVSRIYDNGIYESYYYLNSDGEKVVKPIKKGTAEVKALFKNGKPSREFTLKDGYFDGAYRAFHSNGKLALDYTLVNDNKQGLYKTYYLSGSKKGEWNYFHNYKHGISKVYHENGQLKKSTTYIYGVKHGLEKEFDESGKELSSTYYYDGSIYE